MVLPFSKTFEGDALKVLKTMRAGSVHTVVTSPPYWNLRNYGVDGQIGLEQSPVEYVAKLVQVFSEVYRVLRDDGTLWLNIGDSYTGSGKGGQSPEKKSKNWQPSYPKNPVSTGLKNKEIIGIPWLVAFALQNSGWYLRQDIIWHKPNPMPESVKDRCTKAHEYIFLLTKSKKYFYDAEAIAEPQAEYERARRLREKSQGKETIYNISRDGQTGLADQGAGGVVRTSKRRQELAEKGTKNKRSVWTVATVPFPDAHFATFPPKLITPCILAGTSEKGCCADCGAPYVRIVERITDWQERKEKFGASAGNLGASDSYQNSVHGTEKTHHLGTISKIHLGWQKSCKCETDEIAPCVVMDPFHGSGTTGKVSGELNRS